MIRDFFKFTWIKFLITILLFLFWPLKWSDCTISFGCETGWSTTLLSILKTEWAHVVFSLINLNAIFGLVVAYLLTCIIFLIYGKIKN
jgi:hypothetical protein